MSNENIKIIVPAPEKISYVTTNQKPILTKQVENGQPVLKIEHTKSDAVLVMLASPGPQGEEGPEGPPNMDGPKWIDYVVGAIIPPELVDGGPLFEVWRYTFENNFYYRNITSTEDAFYSSYAGGILSGKVAEKKQSL